MLRKAMPPGARGGFSVAELKDLAIEYLNDYDEELARDPELAKDSHWNLWMDDTDWNDALFVVMIVRRDSVELFCGRDKAPTVRELADNWVGPAEGLLGEARARLAVVGESVRVGRRAAESWLGRGLGLTA
jgi:hypothetical protein